MPLILVSPYKIKLSAGNIGTFQVDAINLPLAPYFSAYPIQSVFDASAVPLAKAEFFSVLPASSVTVELAASALSKAEYASAFSVPAAFEIQPITTH